MSNSNENEKHRSGLRAVSKSFNVNEPLDDEQRVLMYKEIITTMENLRRLDSMFDERFPKDATDRNVKRAFAMASNMEGRGLTDYYLKSEADKVIAELQSKLEAKELEFANLKEDARNTDKAREKWLQLVKKQAMEIRRHKYKRCLSNAKSCEYRLMNLEKMIDTEYRTKKMRLSQRWWRIWLKLAETFKEVK